MEKKVIYKGNFMGFGQSFDGATFDRGGCSPTIRAAASHGSAPYTLRKGETMDIEDYLYEAKDGNQYGIFKLSARECGRLMDVSDEDITKMLSVNSKSQCFKQFGNSIVVNVLVAILGQLFEGKEDVYKEI